MVAEARRLGARGKERTARTPRYPRKRLRLTRRRIGSRARAEHEHEQEDEDEGPNVYNCVSLSERQAGALALQWDFRSSILSYSMLTMLHAPCSLCSVLLASSRPGDEAELVVLL